MAASARPEPVRSGLEPGFPLGLQRVADPLLVAAVHDHRHGRFILPLLQTCAGMFLDWCWSVLVRPASAELVMM
jgi:hypothetical protein